jgi:hypothetical protein
MALALGVPALPRGRPRQLGGLPHRQELVGERRGVRFVNDSKATNADSAALRAGQLRARGLDRGRLGQGRRHSPHSPAISGASPTPS